MRVLIVEDQKEMRELLDHVLHQAGFTIDQATSCATARPKIQSGGYGAIVLDWMLGDGSGLDLCREMRRSQDPTPVLMLTAKGEVEDRVQGLDAGADDYLRKPFAAAELTARVRALTRRGPRLEPATLTIGTLEIRSAERRVVVGGRDLRLTAREFDIFDLLARQRGRVVSRASVLLSVWGSEDERGSASLEVLIGRLRRKLAEAGLPELIETHRGIGYSVRRDSH